MKRRAFLWPAFLPLIIFSGVLANWVFLASTASAAPLASASQPGHNTFQQFQQEGKGKNQGTFQRPDHDPGALKPDTNTPNNKPLPSAEPAKMKDLVYVLDDSFVQHRPALKTNSQPAKVQGASIPPGTTPFQIKGSDGRLEVDLPRGSLDFSQATLAGGLTPVGQLLLQIHQISGHYIEEESILGIYQFQIVDSQDHVVQGVKLLQPVTIVYHYQQWELRDLDINPTEVHLAWPTLLLAARAARQSTAGLVISMTNNASAQTLTARSSVMSGIMTASTTPELEAPAHPDLFATSGNAGQYSYSYPLAVAPGPDGFAPQLALIYSSQSTNERHAERAPAGDEGEGFSLSLGSITMTKYPGSSTGGAATWYSINGVDGVSDLLVPAGSGYYMTEHISDLSIYYTGDHWRVYSKDGTYYELGKTSDSKQSDSSGVYEWDLDKVLAPFNSTSQVKTMFIKYHQDMGSDGTTVRDAGIKQIQYGYATSNTATSLSLVAGTVDFHYHAPSASSTRDGLGNPFAVAYGTNYHCSNPPYATTLRCDDPPAYNNTSLNETIPAPDVMSSMTLDSVTSYVGLDSNNQPAYRYDFSYQDTPFGTSHYDPITGVQETGTGNHLLTRITPTVYLQGSPHARKSVVFSYSGPLRDSYRDPSGPNSGQNYSGQTYWQYLTAYRDLQTGVGATISYETAYGNMDGTPYTTDSQGNVDDRFDPLYCSKHTCSGDYSHPDDYSWSLQVVTQIQALGTDSSGNTTVATTTYQYALTQVPTANTPVSSCNPITGSGVPQQESACVADTWVPGYNGSSSLDKDGDWQDYYHSEFRGFNIVYTTSWSNDLTVDYYFSTEGWWKPEADGLVYNGGQRYREDVYQGDVATPSALLRETLDYYTGVNVPGGNLYPHNSCHGSLSALYTPCVVASMETKTTFSEGQTTNAPWIDTQRTYDDLSTSGGVSAGYHNLIQQVTSGSNAPTITQKWQYVTTDHKNSSGWQDYYDVDKVSHSEIDDASGHVWGCQDTTYDEGASGVPIPAAGLPTTVTSYSTCGNSSTAIKSYIGYDQYGNVVATVDPLGVANSSLYTSKGCTLSPAPVYLSTSWTAGRYTSCTAYDTSETADLPVTQSNALGQATSLSYDYTSGALPTSTTDPNNQPTSYSYSYDSSGNETISVSAPGETTGSYTSRQVENSQCTSSSTLPCYEIDSNSSLYPNAVSRTFYDALGRAVETRTPGPTPGDDTVVMTVYNDQNHAVWQSEPFQVADGSGWIDPTGAKDINGNAPAGTTTFYDALGRVIATRDLNYGSSQEPGIACSATLSGTYTACVNYSFGLASGTTDPSYYASVTNVDPNGHVTVSYTNVQGETRYIDTFSGVYGGTLTVQQVKHMNYGTPFNEPTAVWVYDMAPQSGQTITSVATTTMTYDDLGRLLTEVDPDQGTFTYSYDPDGHVTSVVQTSGSNSRTLGVNYDLLGRVGCEQTAAPTSITWNGACSAGSPLLQNTYDTTKLGTQGSTDFPVGRLTQSIASTYFPDGTSATVTDQFQYDQRGRTITAQMQFGLPSGWNVTTALPAYQLTQLYNDADQPTTTSTNASGLGYTFTQVYDSTTGVLTGLSNNGSSTANLATLAYNVNGLLSQLNFSTSTGASGLATEQFGYDQDLRPNSTTAVWASGSGQNGSLFSQTRSYDNAGNVTSLTTSQAQVQGQSASGGTQTENFCYDEQNRLIWAGNSGSQPGAGNGTCGSGTLSNTLSGAGYSSGYAYTNLGQLWLSPTAGGSQTSQYLYCDSSHPHQLTGIYALGSTCTNRGSASYSVSYDPWGNVTARSFNAVTSTLSYDQLNQMVQWSAGNNQEQYVYDGSGERVLKRSTSGGTTTMTVYAFGLEELQYQGNGTNLGGTNNTYYYSLGGMLIGKFDGTNTTFFMTDGLGSVVASFSNTAGSAAVLGNQTYEPYGKSQYQQGNMGTSKGYTGQYNDNLSGLDYYGARYYDPIAGVFLSPDSVQGNAQGMDPYAYVSGNPETYVDPTGHVMEIPGMGGGDGEIQGEGDFSEGDASYVEPTDVSINYEVDSNILQQEEQGLNNEGTPAEQVNLEQDQRQMEQKLREEEQQGENQPTQPTQPENPSQPAEPDNPSQPSNTGNGDITNAPTHEPTNQPSEGDPFTPPENGNYNEAANSLAQTVYSEIQATGVNMTHVDVSVGFTDNGLTLVSVDQRWIDAGATSIEDDVANAAQSVTQNLLGDQGMYVGPTQLIYRRSGWIEAQHAEDYIMDAVSHLDTDLIGIGSFPLEVCRVCENRIIPVYPALEPGINSFH